MSELLIVPVLARPTKLSLSEAKRELHRLKVMHRSWMRATAGASNPADFQANARVIRRWMRPVRRRLKRTRLR